MNLNDKSVKIAGKTYINCQTTIFQFSKKYGATRLKVAPNMADPINLNERRP